MNMAGLRTGKSLKKSGAIQPPQLKPDPLTVMIIFAAAPEGLNLDWLGINVVLSGLSLNEEEGLEAFPER